MATNCKHTEWILETIDHLRRRKARPDLDRICHVVRRRHGLSAAETEAKIEKLVDAEIVIKVDYKGSTSYRNAAKWRKSMLGCAVMNSTSISTKILRSIIALAKTATASEKKTSDPEGLQSAVTSAALVTVESKEAAVRIGASLSSINLWLQKNCEGFDNLKSPMTVVLKREVDAGRIRKLDNGNYVITPEQIKAVHEDAIKPLKVIKKVETKISCELLPPSQTTPPGFVKPASYHNNAPASSVVQSTSGGKGTSGQQHHSADPGPAGPVVPQPARRGRPPKNRTGLAPPPRIVTPTTAPPPTAAAVPQANSAGASKLKRILTTAADGLPSEASEKKMARKTGFSAEPVCDFCRRSSLSNAAGVPEILLFCKDCTARAHPSCMKYSQLLASRASKGPWQCMDCKTCIVCQDPGSPDQMLFCDGCDKGYHMSCHQPSINKKPSGKWECSECKLENAAAQRTDFLALQGLRLNASADSSPPTPAQSPIPHVNGDFHLSPLAGYESVYPDASNWTVDDVVKYLSSVGFSEEAKIFREQEIDGVALLLLKRADVLKGLELKLGPALKINRHIQGLQMSQQNAA
ncbi:atherin isoform X2 [Aplysia californica]|uniref:Atherin isoform X2 n=1 Tax=Aplysia californica TaxID=6500 RepID=A0ABM0JKI6_APLCA|nr:atherin isoform X2 [Aplysia californica]